MRYFISQVKEFRIYIVHRKVGINFLQSSSGLTPHITHPLTHTEYMSRALSLAAKGRGFTSPNPMVGCVIVKGGRVIGEGWHHQYGHPHAEIEAINNANSRGENVRGATVYVTLEPCSHYGKTPPCANRLVDEGVSEVIIAMEDPNPKVSGNGIKILREAGIKVTMLPEFQQEAMSLNRGFIFLHKHGRPFITLKAAMSLDGRMCLSNGASKWITGIEARTEAHRIRAMNDAVLVGVGTVISDDPELTVRHVEGINPLRVILDSSLKTPITAKAIGHDGKCLILTSENPDPQKLKALTDSGVEVATLPSRDGNIDLHSAVKYLAGKGVLTLMVEGGPEILSAFLREGLADYAYVFTAPVIFGGGKSITFDAKFHDVKAALWLVDAKTKVLGNDIMTEGMLTCSPGL
ncbi:MAG: bifunctional diaminohydroxyphosphoribosylaminopyrimidine deaminase/5-amino-6-(5-phosphoribosylamino)uracil reductase RibD [Synergistaceae bacterium]|nr:bifunctional diaminohydroxyphosphoribosylaminopyrimidine deaminase/5-amino-6-(5-phosphoribosylamino)uracil reductase RibD [Synergistaceae bacterium]